MLWQAILAHRHFNPPSPWGEGPYAVVDRECLQYFNPPSPWGEGLLSAMTFSK